jgi:hypothetical protein
MLEVKGDLMLCAGCEIELGDEVFTVAEETYCNDCFNDNCFTCNECSDIFSVDEANEVNGYNYCDDCYNENYTNCEWCSENVHDDNTNYLDCCEVRVCDSHGTYFCERCDATMCEDCIISLDDCDDYNYLCSDCNSSIDSSNLIHKHGFKPELYFYGENKYKLYAGIELETEMSSDHSRALAAEITKQLYSADLLNSNPDDQHFINLQYDGSLEGGYEIVTQPIDIFNFGTYFDFSNLEKLIAEGVRSFDSDRCGIHIHLSREAFSDTHLWRFMKMFYKNEYPISILAQRRNSRWASFSNEVNNVGEYIKDKKCNDNRYVALNLQNSTTIEVRVFKGTMRATTIQRHLELLSALYLYTLNMKLQEVKDNAMIWSRFANYVLDNSELYPNLSTHKTITDSNNYSKEMI